MQGGPNDTLTTLETAINALINEPHPNLDTETLTNRSCRLQRLTNQLDAVRSAH